MYGCLGYFLHKSPLPILVADLRIKTDEDAGFWHFFIGVLNSVDTELNARSLALTYGFTMINGRFIKTGRVESADGETYFDLDNSEIGGRIMFMQNGQKKTLEEVANESLESKDFINNTLPGLLDNIQQQLDGQIEQFFYGTDPSPLSILPTADAALPNSGWTTSGDKETHLGDLYYNTSSGKVWRYVKIQWRPKPGYAPGTFYCWQELQDSELAQAIAIANEALELGKTKNRVFTSQPIPPYSIGDLWVQGETGDIMRCKVSRESGNYTASDWEKASKYTDNTALYNFINGAYTNAIDTLTTQIDGKIETWFQTTDPASSWTSADKAKHVGDMWYNTGTKELKCYRKTITQSGGLSIIRYNWQTIEDKTAIAAYEAASQAQDTADGKRRVFVAQPYPPYDVGDLWVDGKELRRCITARESGTWYVNDWVVAVYYDNTQTTIDGGIVTSGTIQVAGDNKSILAGITGNGTTSDAIRFWAGASFENRKTAPFRVMQDGSMYATKAYIEGEIHATKGEFRNVDVFGSFRSPFVLISDSFKEQQSDNIYSQYLGSHVVCALPWDNASSGRRFTVIGSVNITAPSGKVFYEDGRAHSKLTTSYEVVELLGFGASSFQGYIVLSRTMFRSNYGHGRRIHPLAFGTVNGTSKGANIRYWTFDENSMAVERLGTGKYKITFPTNWFYSSEYIIALATGVGSIDGGTNPLYANVMTRYTNSTEAYIIVRTADDSSVNDGSFTFMLYNASTWDD